MHYWYEVAAEMLVRADPGRYSQKVALLIYKKMRRRQKKPNKWGGSMTWRGWGVSHLSWAMRWVLLVLASSLAWVPASALPRPVVSLSSQVDTLALTERLEFLVDDAGNWQPGMPTPGSGFSPVGGRWSRDNFGTREAHVWFRTTLATGDTGGGDWLWVVANPHLDQVDVIVMIGGQTVARWSGGNASAGRADTARAHPFLLAPLALKARTEYTVYTHVHSSGVFYVPLSLWRPHAFWQADQVRYGLSGLYFGLVAGLFAYNLFLYLLIRERVYLYYLGCILALTLSQLANTGLGAQWVWPAWAASSTLINNASIACSAALAMLFLRAFLKTPRTAPRIDRWLRGSATAWLVLLVVLPFLGNVVAGYILGPAGFLTVVFLTLITLNAVRERRPGAQYFALAWVTLFFAGALFALFRLGAFPHHPVLANIMMLGSSLELVLLSFALADRIRSDRLAKERAIAERTAATVRRDAAQRALAERSSFMATVTHDIQQPLYAMRLAMQNMVLPPASSQLGAQIAQIRSAMQLTDDLLGSLATAVHLDRADFMPSITRHCVQEMLERVELLFEPLAQQRNLDWRVTPCVAWVKSDPMLLQRMVCNLVANAIRYTERGGVLLSCRVRRTGLLLQVWDTGPGIALDEQSAVFEEYFRGGASQASQSGLGLGLSIVRRCAHLLGIQVSMRSVVGRGTCFQLLVPLESAAD